MKAEQEMVTERSMVNDWRSGLDGLAPEKRKGRTTVDGWPLEAVTDGRAIAIAVSRSEALPVYTDQQKVTDTIALIWRTPPPEVGHRVRLEDLLRTIGPPRFAVREDCAVCAGTGRDPESDPTCECDCCACDECDDGDDVIEPEPRPSYVPGFLTTFDANLLALALTGVTGKDMGEHVWFADMAPTMNAVAVFANGWRVVCMARTRHEGEDGWAEMQIGDAR